MSEDFLGICLEERPWEYDFRLPPTLTLHTRKASIWRAAPELWVWGCWRCAYKTVFIPNIGGEASWSFPKHWRNAGFAPAGKAGTQQLAFSYLANHARQIHRVAL